MVATATAKMPAVQSSSDPTATPDSAATPAATAPESAATTTGELAVTPTSQSTQPTAAADAAGAVSVRISAVIYPGQQSREVIVIVNEGNDTNLNGWTIVSPRGKTFTFGNLTLYKDSFINVHTTNGDNTATDLFWNETAPVWASGDNVALKQGNTSVATYAVK